MRTYENKDELKNEINKSFAKYISEFDIIPESLKDKRVEEVDRTPAENLAYQVGWTTLVLKWESDERNGLHVKTPSDDFKWNQLGELYQWFTDTYAYLSLQELKDMLRENINSIYEMIDSLSDEELFEPHMRKWADEATKTAVWEVYKFIHVNTVAPFGTFRTKIRKWKNDSTITSSLLYSFLAGVWGPRHAPTRSCPKRGKNFQELKICGHGTILALS